MSHRVIAAAALRADLLRVQVEGQTVYVRGTVDNSLESAAVPGAPTVNDAVVVDAP